MVLQQRKCPTLDHFYKIFIYELSWKFSNATTQVFWKYPLFTFQLCQRMSQFLIQYFCACFYSDPQYLPAFHICHFTLTRWMQFCFAKFDLMGLQFDFSWRWQIDVHSRACLIHHFDLLIYSNICFWGFLGIYRLREACEWGRECW